MRYISTRGGDSGVTAKEAISRGLANDGGLYVPEVIPKLDRPLSEVLSLPYPDLARYILRFYLNFSEDELKTCVSNAYTNRRFTHPKIAPLKDACGVHFLELFHGPTLAFKDMALSVLPYLFKASTPPGEELVILTATSGDTGKAALEAFCNVDGVSIVVFYPEKGVSNLQKRQMITQAGNNTYVFGVKGNFDDTQTGVKKIFMSQPVSGGKKFSSANSINIGRLLPQIVYYFYAYAQLNIKTGEEVNFVVPTGNFGNILAGYYAKEMGLPIRKLICASNDNKILYDFFRTGSYDKNREFYCTISPSMDILISSNLERLLFAATNSDTVRGMMESLATGGRFKNHASLPDFYGAYTTEEETRKAIFEVWQKCGYVMDTHTAVAYHAGQKYTSETGDTTGQIIISTASPYKFAEDVLIALGDTPKNDDMATVRALSEKTGLPIPKAVSELEHLPVRHSTVCSVEDMAKAVEDVL